MTTQRLLTSAELRAFLRISERTLGRYISEHGLPTIHLPGARRFDPDAVARWLAKSESAQKGKA